MCVVESTFDVTKKRIYAESVVVGAAVVMDKRVGSNGGVVCARGVEKQCSGANCGIVIRGVEGQRSRANSSVAVGGDDREQRKPANSRVCRTGGERTKGVAPFCCGEVRIASVRRRDDCLRAR